MRCLATTTLLLLLVSPVAAPADDSAACIKKVFNRYCLGGSVSTLPSGWAGTNGTAYVYHKNGGGEFDGVLVEKGLIVRVIRNFPYPTLSHVTDLMKDMASIYGEGKYSQDLPEYVGYDADAIATAISLHKGWMSEAWTQGEMLIYVQWENGDNYQVVYEAPALRSSELDRKKAEGY